ncbi:phenylacetate--CoA ligase family protein [Costertonia aggregata]|uniref:CoF synthetase n=1 Tax=Costertonia aggregata TaxID=343403 RepID=A0A7H9AU02_9FLAO|nr:CoF synthetase [Costertonia aggregata]QLG46971.1 CoF synthetase [Costertonia aggregata]
MRSKLFWFVDAIKGGKISEHYKEIAFINSQKNNFSSVSHTRNKLIGDILNHAASTTPYYKDFKQNEALSNFPVIKKTIVQENFEAFKSTVYLDRPKFKVATSGSTGVPFFLYQDQNKKNRNTADTIFFLKKAGYEVGQRLYDIEVWRNINMMTPLKAWMKNLVYVDISKFNDADIDLFIANLKKDTSPKNLVGFASAFENICQHLDKIGSKPFTNLKIASIIAISEHLNDYVKSSMKKYFNANVVSRYSNEEIGIIAQQIPGAKKTDFQINWASYHLEILKMDSDRPAEPNEKGRIVITDLFNYCMPMIRYDTGDIASFDTLLAEDAPFPKLTSVEGRKMDSVFNTNGEAISPFLIYTKFYPFYHLIKQYQFIQVKEKKYLIKLNTHTGSFEHRDALIQSFQEDFGNDAVIALEMVDEIPPLSSGKRKKVVNLNTGKK